MGRGGQTATRQKSLVKHVPVHVMRMHTSEMTKETTRVVLENEEIGPRTKMEAGLDDGDGIANGSNVGICKRWCRLSCRAVECVSLGVGLAGWVTIWCLVKAMLPCDHICVQG